MNLNLPPASNAVRLFSPVKKENYQEQNGTKRKMGTELGERVKNNKSKVQENPRLYFSI
jgi:hypothetical protein